VVEEEGVGVVVVVVGVGGGGGWGGGGGGLDAALPAVRCAPFACARSRLTFFSSLHCLCMHGTGVRRQRTPLPWLTCKHEQQRRHEAAIVPPLHRALSSGLTGPSSRAPRIGFLLSFMH
jgi:hypothetical protein